MAISQAELQELVLEHLPPQGAWGEADYLWLSEATSRLIEYTDGYVEVLPMPTEQHQTISGLCYLAFLRYFQGGEAVVVYSPMRLRLRSGLFREPDLLVLLRSDDPRRRNRYWLGADLVLEIVSADDPARDLVAKRRGTHRSGSYAEAGIPEYWIVNPLNRTITVLALRDGAYAEHGVFGRGTVATSPLLPGLAIPVDTIFGTARVSL